MRNGTVEKDASMVQQKQHTLANPIFCSGVGLHSGKKVNLTLSPAKANTGIVFVRTDLEKPAEIKAHWSNVSPSPLCTTISDENGVSVATIEHLMAALAGYNIDNVIVELDGAEVPIMDGSAEPFAFLIECAGIKAQRADRRFIRILKPIEVREGEKWVRIEPSDTFRISFEIQFSSSLINTQQCTMIMGDNAVFRSAIARARTFGFLQDVKRMHAAGLARGGSLDNAIVIDGDKVMNGEGLRYHNEFVRHKILDAIGDLYLAGMPVIGHFQGMCSGHYLNYRLLESVFHDESAFIEETFGPSYGSARKPAYPALEAVA
jgi:UDP-3-O-[3-hydroxymyristoyl] N-acetylglucosamine deacetylase